VTLPVDDAFFRYVTDVGSVGPDQGKGGGTCSFLTATPAVLRPSPKPETTDTEML
jgi:hypothetical protein